MGRLVKVYRTQRERHRQFPHSNTYELPAKTTGTDIESSNYYRAKESYSGEKRIEATVLKGIPWRQEWCLSPKKHNNGIIGEDMGEETHAAVREVVTFDFVSQAFPKVRK
jgi:hypothetical protein